jgi:hypothetical protein
VRPVTGGVIDPPAGMWPAMRDSLGARRVTKGMPAGLPDLSALDSHDSSADDATVESPASRRT